MRHGIRTPPHRVPESAESSGTQVVVRSRLVEAAQEPGNAGRAGVQVRAHAGMAGGAQLAVLRWRSCEPSAFVAGPEGIPYQHAADREGGLQAAAPVGNRGFLPWRDGARKTVAEVELVGGVRGPIEIGGLDGDPHGAERVDDRLNPLFIPPDSSGVRVDECAGQDLGSAHPEALVAAGILGDGQPVGQPFGEGGRRVLEMLPQPGKDFTYNRCHNSHVVAADIQNAGVAATVGRWVAEHLQLERDGAVVQRTGEQADELRRARGNRFQYQRTSPPARRV